MDEFLATVGVQAMRYAIRSGIALTSSYAIGQCSRLLKSVEDKAVHAELKSLRNLLDSKIKIISPAIDLIEFKSGRGNVFLESAAPLAKSLHKDIVSLGRRIEAATTVDSSSNHIRPKSPPVSRDDLLLIAAGIKALLERIDREIPLLQLAITASGESLSTSLPAGISPSRLLQASTLLTVGDTQFAQDPTRPVQIGPAFTLSLYMLFLGHASTLMPHGSPEVADTTVITNNHSSNSSSAGTSYGLGEGERKPLWQEVLHKARVRICRTRKDFHFDSQRGYCAVPLEEYALPPTEATGGGEYAYHLEIIEDLDDGRVHDDERDIQSYDDIPRAGIRESIPVHQLSKIFYTDTGRILNIGSATDSEQRPVLLLKRDTQAGLDRSEDGHISGLIEEIDRESSGSVLELDSTEDEQADIDKQLLDEFVRPAVEDPNIAVAHSNDYYKWKFPAHLDPEWIALEVYEEQDDDDPDEEDDNDSLDSAGLDQPMDTLKPSTPRDRTPLDSRVIDQIKRLSLGSPEKMRSLQATMSSPTETENFVSRSPFGAITTSLSLMEMLVRLASLQEFQQTSHLAIPDHILTFFLEETSTTGLVGETQWRARSEAKRRMGFDPYTDAPAR
ncbi:RanGTP-binding protein-domain-containing protein [Fusarium flagelliforme]|uniref:RanGTP-binding protein-domain-containing protein n=1 Tax=Fusarium flagelliforme TaxID=2675880 RepID=UPI001E8D59EB|nr:RanGTP-binding protein-domain-containing protein [Fusarium flagelliforme]KAH7185632.1 RanGTP-binding protein-domain-containing protein [Fusarium flagelliforme]